MAKDQTDELLDELIGNDKELQKYSDEVNLSFDIAVEVRKLRESMHMSQAEFAKLVNKPQSTISKIETASTNTKMNTLQDIVSAAHKKLVISIV